MNIQEQIKKLKEVDERGLLLRQDNQSEAEKYVSYLMEVRLFKQELIDKKHAANKEISKLKNRIVELSTELFKEDNPVKQHEIATEKEEVRNRLSDLNDLIHTNVSAIIEAKYIKDAEKRNSYEERCSREYIIFKQELSNYLDDYIELKRLAESKIDQLNSIKMSHRYNRIDEYKRAIKTISEQNDGWVSKRPIALNGETTYKYWGFGVEDN